MRQPRKSAVVASVIVICIGSSLGGAYAGSWADLGARIRSVLTRFGGGESAIEQSTGAANTLDSVSCVGAESPTFSNVSICGNIFFPEAYSHMYASELFNGNFDDGAWYNFNSKTTGGHAFFVNLGGEYFPDLGADYLTYLYSTGMISADTDSGSLILGHTDSLDAPANAGATLMGKGSESIRAILTVSPTDANPKLGTTEWTTADPYAYLAVFPDSGEGEGEVPPTASISLAGDDEQGEVIIANNRSARINLDPSGKILASTDTAELNLGTSADGPNASGVRLSAHNETSGDMRAIATISPAGASATGAGFDTTWSEDDPYAGMAVCSTNTPTIATAYIALAGDGTRGEVVIKNNTGSGIHVEPSGDVIIELGAPGN